MWWESAVEIRRELVLSVGCVYALGWMGRAVKVEIHPHSYKQSSGFGEHQSDVALDVVVESSALV